MEKIVSKTKWGFLRETERQAEKAGIDKDTGLHRTGLEKYLLVIFPEIKAEDWVHDKTIPGLKKKIRPDYRCEKLKLIVEFDGLPHYKNPDRILADEQNDIIYQHLGYKVVRIPYFIQLTNDVIEKLFGREVDEPMFDGSVPSLGISGRNTPAYCCPAGIIRMAKIFKVFPQQYKVNLKALQNTKDEFLSCAKLLEKVYDEIDE